MKVIFLLNLVLSSLFYCSEEAKSRVGLMFKVQYSEFIHIINVFIGLCSIVFIVI